VNNPIGDGGVTQPNVCDHRSTRLADVVGSVVVDPALLLRPAGDEVLKVWSVSNNGVELLGCLGESSQPRQPAFHAVRTWVPVPVVFSEPWRATPAG
jgi:hypothetical protein